MLVHVDGSALLTHPTALSMPRLALAIVALWFASLFAFRTALQWWKTGSGGVHGFSGAVGSLEWNAGALASLGLVAGAFAPVAALLTWPGGSLFFSSEAIHLGGAALAAIGIIGALASQVAMGESWRIGVDESEATELVTHGTFAWVRNPIFSFILLSGTGLVALVPNTWSVLALALTFAGIEIQVRVVEEPYLEKTHGSAYRAYASQAGRFVPRVGRLSATSPPPNPGPGTHAEG